MSICHKNRTIRSHYRLTTDKRLRYASPKLPLATSFIRKMLAEIRPPFRGKEMRLELRARDFGTYDLVSERR